MKSKLFGAAALGALAFGFAGTAAAQDYSGAVFIGDSLTDPGNIPGITGVNFPSAPYVGNRFSNGPVYAEILPGLLGIDDANVENFAVGGAFTGQLEVSPGVFFGNITTSLSALANTDALSQVSDYLGATGGVADPDALYTVFAGANNYFVLAAALATSTNPQADIQAGTQNAVNDIIDAAESLIAAGAETVVIPNLPDLGTTASSQAGDPAAAAGATVISDFHNSALEDASGDLARATGADIVFIDLETLTNDMQANPGKYGLVNTSDQCILTPACVTGDVATQNTFQFWDGVHPTTGVHAFAAAYVADAINAPFTVAGQAETVRLTTDATRQRISGLDLSGFADENGHIIFVDGGYFDFDRDAGGATVGYSVESYDIAFGYGHTLGDGWIAAYVGRVDAETDYDGVDAALEGETWYAGATLQGYFDNGLGLGLDMIYGGVSMDTSRNTGVAGQVAAGSFEGSTLYLSTTLDMGFELGPLSVTPAATLGFIRASLDGYGETGAVGLNQQVSARDASTAFGEIGVTASGAFALGETAKARPRLGAVFHTDFDEFGQTVRTNLVTAGQAVRRLETEGLTDDGVRIEGGVLLQKGRLGLDVSGAALTGRDDGDGFLVNARLMVGL